jgi:hypothetical protein
MSLFIKNPRDTFEKLFFKIYYSNYKSRLVICYERDRFFFASNDLSQCKIVEYKKQKHNVVIPIFFAISLMGFAILQNDILFQFLISIVSLMLLIISFSVKKNIYTIKINESKIDYCRYDLDIKFKKLEGITFYKTA